MEEHAEPTHVGRGVGVDWVAKQTFETEAEMKAYCAENLLSRGRINHNIGRRFTYLICAHDGGNFIRLSCYPSDCPSRPPP